MAICWDSVTRVVRIFLYWSVNLSKIKHEKVDYLAHIRSESGTTNDGELLSNVILGGQDGLVNTLGVILGKIGRASCRERV